jgi:hypothetical protein
LQIFQYFTKMAVPALRVLIDGDSDKVYRRGDTVTGRVVLVVDEAEQIQSLKMVFAGNCVTKTSRPFHVNGGEDSPSRREYEEKFRLFNQEKVIISESTLLAPKKYMWTFEFTFPESTEPRFKRLSRGANYLREPHPLPPTFQLKTNSFGGAAQISYFLQARLTLSESRGVKRCRVLLPYLYGQAWKPAKDAETATQKAVKKAFTKVSRRALANDRPRIIPSLLYPEMVAPGQHIPISLVLRNTRDAVNEAQGKCVIDSLSISISTYTTTMCGQSVTQPEDVVSKHITCIARTNMNKPALFGTTVPLTSNFRLIDDMECIPTFKTYTITRRYTLGISIGLKHGNQHFVVRSNTPLDILPRRLRNLSAPALDDGEEFEPLPLYAPREPSKEFAPDYESIFALSRTSSASTSLAPTYSRSSSYMSGMSGTSVSSTAASTPMSEIEEPIFEHPGSQISGVRA